MTDLPLTTKETFSPIIDAIPNESPPSSIDDDSGTVRASFLEEMSMVSLLDSSMV